MKTHSSNTTEQCRATLGKERIIKSVLSGGSVGLAAGFVIAFITWFFEFKGMWLSIGVGLGLGVAASLLFYFLVFKTTTRDVMARVDRAGLDERMITMLEFQGDDSYMASRQRADAQAVFSAAVTKSAGSLIKTKIPAFIIALTCVSGSTAVAAVTVTACSDYGVIPTGMQLVTGDWEGNPTISNGRLLEVVFQVGEDGGGHLVGELVQTVRVGEQVAAVEAFADEEEPGWVDMGGFLVMGDTVKYYFVGWKDETNGEITYGRPVFAPTVTSAKVYTAVFEKVAPGNDQYYSYYFDPEAEGKRGDGDGDDGEGDGPDIPDIPNNPDPSSGASSGAADTNDTVIDGQTQVGEVAESYVGEANGELSEGKGNLPPELVETIEGYLGTL